MPMITIVARADLGTAAETLRGQLDGISLAGMVWECTLLELTGGSYRPRELSGRVLPQVSETSGFAGVIVFLPGVNGDMRKEFTKMHRGYERDGKRFMHVVHLSSDVAEAMWSTAAKKGLRDGVQKHWRALKKRPPPSTPF